MSVLDFPTRSLTPIDIRVVKVISVALGWDVEISRSADSEAYALITSRSHEDIVYTLEKGRGDYVLTKYGYYPESPRELTRGSLETALMALPGSHATSN